MTVPLKAGEIVDYPKRKPLRLKNYDYSKAGYYFITICTFRRLPVFGNIESGKMSLSPYGKIVDAELSEIRTHYPGVTSDYSVAMPNHIHCILNIHNGNTERS